MRRTLRPIGILLGILVLGYLLLSYVAQDGHPYYEHTAGSPSREVSKERQVYLKDQLDLTVTSTIPDGDSVAFDVWLDKRMVTRVFGSPGIPLGRKEYADRCVINLANLNNRSDLIFQLQGTKDKRVIVNVMDFILPRAPGSAEFDVFLNLGHGEHRFLGTITCAWRS